MNIAEFFQSQSPSHLTQAQKSALYADFLKKRERWTSSVRRSLVSHKLLIYGAASIAAVSVFFFGKWTNILAPSENIYNNTNVSAQNIGTILESKGDVTIINNWRAVIATTIQLNDQIVVSKGASIKVLINDAFQADILWPATFEIVPTAELNDRTIYNLKFSNGWDYIAINTPHDEIQKNEIAVQTMHGVMIKNRWETHKSSFTIVNSSSVDTTTILNKSATSLEVTKASLTDSKEDQSSITIEPTKIVQVSTPTLTDDDLTVITTEILTQAKEDSIITDVSASLTEKVIPAIAKVPNTATNSIVKTLPDDKEIDNLKFVVQKQISSIEQNLYWPFIYNDIKNIVVYHLLGNENAAQISYNNLNLRIERIWTIIDLPNKWSVSTIQELLDRVIALQDKINNKYTSDTVKIRYNLQSLRSWLELLKDYKFGVYKNITNLSGSSQPLSFEDLLNMMWVSPSIRKYKFR